MNMLNLGKIYSNFNAKLGKFCKIYTDFNANLCKIGGEWVEFT